MTLKFAVGDLTIHRIIEQETSFLPALDMLPGLTPERLAENRAWMRQASALDGDDVLILCFQSYIVNTPHHTILVDSCIGNDKPRPLRPKWNMKTDDTYMRALAASGFAVGDIDFVMCTHLHVDHVGWNTMLVDGKWVPTFPNAHYLIGKTEYDHWRETQEGETIEIMNDSVEPIFASGLAQTVDMDHRVSPELRLMPTPGHTPGHVSVMIESKGETAIITGDMIHHPCQFGRPDWLSMFDADQTAANARRHMMFAQWADKPILVIGTHFAAPTAGRIKSDGAAWRFEGQP
jgi:glyoxylase-like metal-dependent hydrolase (beta-lactamase superfamily II)